jgi:hypothetical protein
MANRQCLIANTCLFNFEFSVTAKLKCDSAFSGVASIACSNLCAAVSASPFEDKKSKMHI